MKDNLLELIRTLTSSEKRYFILYAGTHVTSRKNNYLKLFEALDALPQAEVYNEKAFKRSLRGKSWGKNLASEKGYLYQLIMQSLRSYHAHGNEQLKLYNQLAEVSILRRRDLNQQALDLIDKALQTAEYYEALPVIIELLHHKRCIEAHDVGEKEFDPAEFDKGTHAAMLHQARRLLLEAEANYERRRIDGTQVANRAKQDAARTKKQLAHIEQCMEEMPDHTFYTKVQQMVISAHLSEVEERFEDQLRWYRSLMHLIDNHKKRVMIDVLPINVYLSGYIRAAYNGKKFELMPPLLDRLSKLPSANKEEEVYPFTTHAQMQMIYLLNTPDKTGWQKMIDDSDKGMQRYAGRIDRMWQRNQHLNVAIVLIQVHAFEQLRDRVQLCYQLLSRSGPEVRFGPELRTYEAIALYGCGETDLLTYHLANMERWLRNHDMLTPFYRVVIRFYKQLLNNTSKQEALEQLAAFACTGSEEMMKEIIRISLTDAAV